MFEGYNYVEKNGQGAKKRFSDPKAVRAVYQKLCEDDNTDALRRDKIKKLYNGNLPYDPKVLEASGMKNLTNVNFLGLKGVIDNRADVILRLQFDTANLIDLRPLARELAGPDADKISRVVSEEFSAMLRENGRFIPALARMNREADLYGIGPVTWANDIDYCPIAMERGAIRIMNEAPSQSSQQELVMFESTLSAGFLRSLLDSPEIASALGWNVEQVAKWLIDVYRNGKNSKNDPGFVGTSSPLESLTTMVRMNVLTEDHQFDQFHVIHAFVKEVAYPRGVTHLVIPSSGEGDKFLYEKQNAYATMDECFLWFPYSITEVYAREIRGLASFLYPIEKLNNRYLCQTFDAAFKSTAMVLQRQSAGTSSDLTINEQGPYILLPPGVQLAPSGAGTDLQRLMVGKQLLDSVGVASVTGTDKGPVGTTGPRMFNGASQGATKAEIEVQQQIRAHQNEAEFSLRQEVLNKILRQTFLRALRITMMDEFTQADYPEIGEWVRRCALRQVTLDQMLAIPEMFSIVTCRDLALGSDGKVMELDNYVQLYGASLDEAGRKYIARNRAILRFGVSEADRMVPEISRDQAPSDQASLATLENHMMQQGGQPMVGQDQWHWSHIPIHAQILQQIVEQVRAPEDNTGGAEPSGSLAEQTLQNVPDPRSMLQLLTVCSQHIQEHVQIGGMQIGMQAQAEQVMRMIRDLRPTVKALNLAVATQERVEQAEREKQEREMQALQEAANQNELQKEMYKADRQAEVGRYKADLEHDIALRRLGLDSELQAAKSEREDQMALDRSAREDRESNAKMDREAMMNDAKINAANAASRMDTMTEATGYSSVQPSDIVNGAPMEVATL